MNEIEPEEFRAINDIDIRLSEYLYDTVLSYEASRRGKTARGVLSETERLLEIGVAKAMIGQYMQEDTRASTVVRNAISKRLIENPESPLRTSIFMHLGKWGALYVHRRVFLRQIDTEGAQRQPFTGLNYAKVISDKYIPAHEPDALSEQ